MYIKITLMSGLFLVNGLFGAGQKEGPSWDRYWQLNEAEQTVLEAVLIRSFLLKQHSFCSKKEVACEERRVLKKVGCYDLSKFTDESDTASMTTAELDARTDEINARSSFFEIMTKEDSTTLVKLLLRNFMSGSHRACPNCVKSFEELQLLTRIKKIFKDD